jgi:hypothetical protein
VKKLRVNLTRGVSATIISDIFCLPICNPKIKLKIYSTIILRIVLFGRENLSLTSMEEHRLRLFENRVLRRKFGPKRDR